MRLWAESRTAVSWCGEEKIRFIEGSTPRHSGSARGGSTSAPGASGGHGSVPQRGALILLRGQTRGGALSNSCGGKREV